MSTTEYEHKVTHPYPRVRAHVLDGPEGVIALTWHWEAPKAAAHLRRTASFFVWDGDYWAADLGVHRRTDPGDTDGFNEHCNYTDGPCWYDGSGLQAERVARLFIEQGEDALWDELADWYKSRFRAVPS